jgi:hypothetical protein
VVIFQSRTTPILPERKSIAWTTLSIDVSYTALPITFSWFAQSLVKLNGLDFAPVQDSPDTPLIIGVSVGGGVILAVTAIMALIFVRRRMKFASESSSNLEYVDATNLEQNSAIDVSRDNQECV